MSYIRATVATIRGSFTIDVDRGGIYLIGPDLIDDVTEVRIFVPNFALEDMSGRTVQRWKPLRVLSLSHIVTHHVLVISHWFAATMFAVPPLLWWRRRRLNLRNTRGFAIEIKDENVNPA